MSNPLHLINAGNANVAHVATVVNEWLGDKLIQQALIEDRIEGDAGAAGAKKFVESCIEKPPTHN